jgi:hypothetical protein
LTSTFLRGAARKVNKRKCEAVPLCHAGVKGEKRYSSYSFLTLALDWGEWSMSHHGQALPGYLLDRWLGRPQSWLEEKSFDSARDQTTVIQPVVKHHTDRTTPVQLSTPKLCFFFFMTQLVTLLHKAETKTVVIINIS